VWVFRTSIAFFFAGLRGAIGERPVGKQCFAAGASRRAVVWADEDICDVNSARCLPLRIHHPQFRIQSMEWSVLWNQAAIKRGNVFFSSM